MRTKCSKDIYGEILIPELLDALPDEALIRAIEVRHGQILVERPLPAEQYASRSHEEGVLAYEALKARLPAGVELDESLMDDVPQGLPVAILRLKKSVEA